MKSELLNMREDSSARNILQNTANSLEGCVDSIRERLASVRDGVVSWAKNTVENVKLHGISALDKAVAALHIRPALEAIQSGIQGALETTRAAADRAEEMGFQLRESGRAVKNAFRAAVGKEEDRIPAVQEGRFQKTALAPVRVVKGVLNGMNEEALGAVSALERLERAGRDSRERLTEKKPSIREKLKQNGQEYAPAAPSAAEKIKKPREAAL